MVTKLVTSNLSRHLLSLLRALIPSDNAVISLLGGKLKFL